MPVEHRFESILFVCMGNICRSPLAEGMVRAALDEAGLSLKLDSAGTHDYHIGAAPDPRARAVARELGCSIDSLRARQVQAKDFSEFDLILAADAANLHWLELHRPTDAKAETALLLPWCGGAVGTEVPDPYYGDIEDFRHTASLLRRAMPHLVQRLRDRG